MTAFWGAEAVRPWPAKRDAGPLAAAAPVHPTVSKSRTVEPASAEPVDLRGVVVCRRRRRGRRDHRRGGGKGVDRERPRDRRALVAGGVDRLHREAVRPVREPRGLERGRALLQGARVDPADEGRARLAGGECEGGRGVVGERPLGGPLGDARGRCRGVGRERAVRVEGRLRRPVVREQAGAPAADTDVRVGRARRGVAPVEPVQALQVPGASMGEDHVDRAREVGSLVRRADVDSRSVGRGRPPAELGDPEGRCRIPIARHDPADVLNRHPDAVGVRGVGMLRHRVEVGLDARHRVDVVQEVEGVRVLLRRDARGDDHSLVIPRLDRVVGDAQELGVFVGGLGDGVALIERGPEIRLVPDLPGADRELHCGRPELVVIRIRPVAAARTVPAYRGFQEVSPGLLGQSTVDRGARDAARSRPGGRAEDEGGPPDVVRRQASHHPVRLAPVAMAALVLDSPPAKQEAGRLDPGRVDRLHVRVVEQGPLVDAVELRSRGLRPRDREQAERQPGERDRGRLEQPHRRPPADPTLSAS